VAGGRQLRTAGRNTTAAYLPGGARASPGKQLHRGVEELQEDTRTRRGDTRKAGGGHAAVATMARPAAHRGETATHCGSFL
jgi:hypothetical protein